MWEQYKKTFAYMQLMIAIATIAIYLTMNHLSVLAGLFFLVMQLGAVLGAMWATRLKRKLEGAGS